jgi:hypothetical protein
VSTKKAANPKNAASDGEEGDLEEDDASTRSVASRDSNGTKYAGGGNHNVRKTNATTPKEPKVVAKPVAQAKKREVLATVETTANDLIPEDVQSTEVLPHTPSS